MTPLFVSGSRQQILRPPVFPGHRGSTFPNRSMLVTAQRPVFRVKKETATAVIELCYYLAPRNPYWICCPLDRLT